ncbi:hypothetical protein BDW22DRAFT_1360987 [Trametopsis cervina]|nr:hypothetical protein BDW22DRAFT_1360987 [Trametopsis cervina]
MKSQDAEANDTFILTSELMIEHSVAQPIDIIIFIIIKTFRCVMSMFSIILPLRLRLHALTGISQHDTHTTPSEQFRLVRMPVAFSPDGNVHVRHCTSMAGMGVVVDRWTFEGQILLRYSGTASRTLDCTYTSLIC